MYARSALVNRRGGKDYAAESDRVARIVFAANPGATTLLDVACGTGMHPQPSARSFAVTGLELDPATRKIANHRLPGVTVHAGDMRSLNGLGASTRDVPAIGYTLTRPRSSEGIDDGRSSTRRSSAGVAELAAQVGDLVA